MAGAKAEASESFIKACRDGDLALFSSLLGSADVNHVSESLHGIKYTPLGIAIVFNHQEIALRLLDHPNIDVNKKTCESTALHYAALRNNVMLIEAICAKPGVQVHTNYLLGESSPCSCPLFLLSLLQVNQKDYLNDGVTPLAVAVRNKHADAVRQLVKVPEVDLDPLDNDGHSLEFLVRRIQKYKIQHLGAPCREL
jgi:ankyrin repeat protein